LGKVAVDLKSAGAGTGTPTVSAVAVDRMRSNPPPFSIRGVEAAPQLLAKSSQLVTLKSKAILR
jgi:hypothetical protein